MAINILVYLMALHVHAQYVSEIQYKDGKWFVEMTNKEGPPVNSVKIRMFYFDTTVVVEQAIIDSLNHIGAIVVDTLELHDSLEHNGDYVGIDYVDAFFNDTIHTSIIWDHYCLSKPINGYSVSILDSLDLYCDNYGDGLSPVCQNDKWYGGISRPTIGTPNTRDSAFAIIKGKLLDIDGIPYKNAEFTMTNCWNPATGDKIMTTDSAGNAIVATWPSLQYGVCWCENGELFSFVNIPSKQSGFYIYRVSLYPGINNIDIKDLGIIISKSSENNYSKLLQISPNPAKSTITATYQLPAGEDYRRCQLCVSNASGQTVRTVKLQAAGGKQSIPLEGLPRGVYYCTLVGSKGVLQTGRFVVE